MLMRHKVGYLESVNAELCGQLEASDAAAVHQQGALQSDKAELAARLRQLQEEVRAPHPVGVCIASPSGSMWGVPALQCAQLTACCKLAAPAQQAPLLCCCTAPFLCPVRSSACRTAAASTWPSWMSCGQRATAGAC